MARQRSKALTFTRTPSNAMELSNRWNQCQAIARVLYVGPKSTDDLMKMFEQHKAAYERALLSNP